MQEELLMDNNNNKKDIKKPLIYGAIGFLVFVIIVIGVAIYQNTKKDSNVNEILPPEANLQQPKDTEFKPLEVANEPKIDTKKLAQAAEEPQQPVQKTKPKPQKVQVNNQQKVKKETPKVKEQEIVMNEPKEVSKPIEKPKPKYNGKVVKKVDKNVYFVQVAALLRNAKPNPKFLSLITQSGYDYLIYKTCFKKDGQEIKVTKVLVGPFKTRAEALKALKKIKANITQNAFIFRAK